MIPMLVEQNQQIELQAMISKLKDGDLSEFSEFDAIERSLEEHEQMMGQLRIDFFFISHSMSSHGSHK